MKIYAKQVPPEYQESPLFLDEYDLENLYIFGNRNYNGLHTAAIDDWRHTLDDLADDWADLHSERAWCSSWAEALRAAFSVNYSRADRLAWVDLVKYWNRADTYAEQIEVIAAAMHIQTGRRWACCTLRGSCQGDWQYCLYQADEWPRERLDRLEAEYFNTGSEWIVHDGNAEPDGPEEIDGFSCYCIAWDDSGIRQEIADAYGGRPEDVILFKFTGFSKIANYLEV